MIVKNYSKRLMSRLHGHQKKNVEIVFHETA